MAIDTPRRDARGRPRCQGCGAAFEPVRPGQRCCRPSCVQVVAQRARERQVLPLLAVAETSPAAPDSQTPELTLDDVPF